MAPPLSQGVGYGVVIGVGMAFALGMIATTFALKRYQKERMTSEEFATAGRSVKTGLIASAVVSSWTWAATLLQSTTEAYKVGVSGSFYYACGAMVQIVLFATLAIELKRKAPGAHTYLEIVKHRFGSLTHCVFLFFAMATNILVFAMLLAGGSATIEYLTGMHPVAAVFLLPLGVAIYTLFGGLKATFLTDYVHTIILFVIIFLFVFSVFANNSHLGSPGRVWDILVELAKTEPVEGNKDGSFLTFQSRSGGIFMVINLAGNFGTVFLDNGYWNKAIAASPAAALPGYIVGGLSWFAIPWLCATTMGLAARCLENTPSWPTWPNKMSMHDVNAGLTLPNAAVALLGRGGGGAALLMVFMAATSASSAEMVASSSVITYDIYKMYIRPNATGKQLIWVTHASVVGFTLAMIGFSIGLYYGHVPMGYLYTLMGVIISSAVIPASLTIFWSGLNKWSATIAPLLGMALGLMSWVSCTAGQYEKVFTLETTGADYPMLVGNVVSLCSPIVIIAVLQLIFGHANYDFNELKDLQTVRAEIIEDDEDSIDKEKHIMSPEERLAELERTRIENEARWEREEALLEKYSKIARFFCVFVTLAFLIIWPMPMYGSGYRFSKPFFTGWITVGIIWLFCSLFAVGVWPVWEGRQGIWHVMRGAYWDLTGQSRKLRDWQDEHPEELHAVISPVSNISVIEGIEGSLENAPLPLVKRA